MKPLDNHEAAKHMTACRQFAQADPANLERTLQFVLATIQQQLETVPGILQDFAEHGRRSPFAFGSKAKGLDFIAEQRDTLFEAAHLAKSDPDQLLAVFLTVPGLGLVKAGFACQLFAGSVGCLDVHNVKLYGLPANSLAFRKTLSEDTQARKRRDYVGMCRSLGGSIELWARWCDYKASLQPDNWERGGWSVSKFHIECLTNEFDHNILAFIDSDIERGFERENRAA
jgi:hypothetical protein